MSSNAAENTEGGSGNAVLVAIFAAALIVVFIAFRSSDLLRLPTLLGNLGGGPLFGGEGFLGTLVGSLVAGLILVSWFGTGTFISSFIKVERRDGDSHVLELVRNIGVGAVVTSLIWFFLGLAGSYSSVAAIVVTVTGLVLAGLGLVRAREAKAESRTPEPAAGIDRIILLMIAACLFLAFVASLAPPIAKDTLLYHFSVPKAFIAQHSNAFIEGNIASYLALGTEMHALWAMLLGNIVSPRAGEAAAGVTTFLFFPLLLAAVFGWARELNISRSWSLAAVLMVAAIPTAFHVASSGYTDLSLALYISLAVYSLCRWWRTPVIAPLVFAAIFLGGALAVKLTTLFVIAAFALIILLRGRGEVKAGKIVLTGFGALLLAGVIASPWYLRNWSATGSPVFPFYMSIWKGEAKGWDVERSNLFQGMNSQYGGAAEQPVNYLTAPLRLSLAAQPEDANLYDGVLGAAFLIGLPLLIWALWRRRLAPEVVIAAGVAGVIYLFWLFSSQQMRYLLPLVPLLAIAIAASAEKVGELATRRAWMYVAIAASAFGILTSAAWFSQKAPLRVVLGGETRDQYLARNLDYYPFYRAINQDTATDAKIWLINMRRDTYNIDRAVVSDYLFEDWTLRKMLWESRNTQELKGKASSLGVQYVLTRHDFIFDYDRSSLVDDKKPRAENEAKLKIAKDLILGPADLVWADNKFSLIKVF